MKLTQIQKDILNELLDAFERSRSYEGTNQRRQSFRINPEVILPSYRDPFEDVGRISHFEEEVGLLEKEGLVRVRRVDGAISFIEAVPDALADYYLLLNREGRREKEQEARLLFKNALGRTSLTDRLAEEQIRLLDQGKKPHYDAREIDLLVTVCERILNNREEILERELSMELFHDSKVWEKCYRDRIFRIFTAYGDYSSLLDGIGSEKEQKETLFAEYGIRRNPTCLFFKGNGSIRFLDGRELPLWSDRPLGLPSNLLSEIASVSIKDKCAMTVENLTAYHRMCRQDVFYLFLAGYHNSDKQRFLKKMAEDNPSLPWYHFGDIDPDGFLILEHLRRETGIDFQPWHMDEGTFLRWRTDWKALNKGDEARIRGLLEKNLYTTVLSRMLHEGAKLEQEIVAFNEEGKAP